MTRGQLPKLTCPRTDDAVLRHRLFDLLDRRREKPVVWIASPPGSGKTTLVASYLRARKLAHVWYQMDSADNDPATFVYYLGMAAPRQKSPLPLLTPDHLHDLAAFARRFFRTFFQQLPRPSVLVLDNYHDARAASPIHDMLREGLDEVPEGVSVIVISRAPAPNSLARLAAAQTLGQLQWGHLRLTASEAAEIARSKNVLDGSRVAKLCNRSDGWAAGLILMLAHADADLLDEPSSDSQQAVFEYFAGEIFEKAPQKHRNILMKAAFLSRATPEQAAHICDDSDAAKVLESFQRGNYFIERRDGRHVTYQFHGLFRDFLLSNARKHYSAQAYDDLSLRAAALMHASDDSDEALHLYIRGRHWQPATELVLREAPRLLAQGRGETLRAWIDSFPKHYVTSSPWLLYWFGTSFIQLSPVEARHELERAYASFKACGEDCGQLLSAASIVQTYYFEAQDFTPLDAWIPKLECLIEMDVVFDTRAAELAAFTGMVMALVYRAPGHLKLPGYLDRMLDLVDAVSDPNQAAVALLFALTHSWFSANDVRRQRTMHSAAAMTRNAQVSDLTKALLLHRLSFIAFLSGDYGRAHRLGSEGLDLAERHRLTAAQFILVWSEAQFACVMGDRRGGEALAARVEALTNPPRAMDAIYVFWAKAALMSLRGDNEQALATLHSALGSVDRLGLTTLRSAFRLPLALALVEAGRYEEADQHIREATENLANSGMVRVEAGFVLIQALSELLQGNRATCHRDLRHGLGLARQAGSYMVAAGYRSRMLPVLWSEALRCGIETEFVTDLIRKHAYAPPAADAGHWPWTIKIHTLGRFEVLIDDELLTFGRRTPRQPLQLLKLLVAQGGEAHGDLLCEELWPDAEGDAARISLETALHRLRKLLRHDEAIIRQDNGLRLNAALCWVDAFSFERLADRALTHSKDSAATDLSTPPESLPLYSGNFLPELVGESWALRVRARLLTKFLRLTIAHGLAKERSGDWGAAISIYECALQRDPLSEELYRRLIVCHRERGEPSEALKAYLRCRELLSTALGVQPSTETQSLYRSL